MSNLSGDFIRSYSYQADLMQQIYFGNEKLNEYLISQQCWAISKGQR